MSLSSRAVDRSLCWLLLQYLTEVYSCMALLISEHIGLDSIHDITISEINGKPNVVTFRQKASRIIGDFYKQSKEDDTNAEKMRLIKTAAKLIRNDVKSVQQSTEFYPDTNMMSPQEAMSFLPRIPGT